MKNRLTTKFLTSLNISLLLSIIMLYVLLLVVIIFKIDISKIIESVNINKIIAKNKHLGISLNAFKIKRYKKKKLSSYTPIC